MRLLSILDSILFEEIKIPRSDLSREERIKIILSNREYIESMLPQIIKFLKLYYRGLEKVEVSSKPIYYGMELVSIDTPKIKLFFGDKSSKVPSDLEVVEVLVKYLNIDPYSYGTPLDVETIWV